MSRDSRSHRAPARWRPSDPRLAFIDPTHRRSRRGRSGAPVVELHTGATPTLWAARAMVGSGAYGSEACRLARLTVNAGHGLNYHNVEPIAASLKSSSSILATRIIARAVFDGLARRARDEDLMRAAR